METQKTAALQKQLAQLERDGEKMREATRFIQDFLLQEHRGPSLGALTKRNSKDFPTQSPHCTTFQPAGLPSPVQRELQQLQAIKKKLQITAHEIAKLQETWGMSNSRTSSPTEPGGVLKAPASAPATPITNSRSNSSSSSSTGPRSTPPACPSSAPARTGSAGQAASMGSSKEVVQQELEGRPSPIAMPAASHEVAPAPDSQPPAAGNAAEAESAGSRAWASDQQGNVSEARGVSGGTAEADGHPAKPQSSNSTQQSSNSSQQAAKLRHDQNGGRRSSEGAGGEAGRQAGAEVGVGEEEELLAEIARVRPRAAAAARLRSQLSALSTQAEEAETLQARTAEMAAEAEKLPVVRQQLVQFQAAAANVRALEARLASEQRAHPGEGELLTRLQAQERELRARAESVSEVKARMQELSMVALEVEKLEARCAALSPMASRLPVLRAQHETLTASCLEVEALEAQQTELKEVVSQRRRLQMQINVLQPQADGVEALRAQVAQLQQGAAEYAGLRRVLQACATNPKPSPSGSSAYNTSASQLRSSTGGVAAGRQQQGEGPDIGSVPDAVEAPGSVPLTDGRVNARPGQQDVQRGTMEVAQQQQHHQQQQHLPPKNNSSNSSSSSSPAPGTLQGLSPAASSLLPTPTLAPSSLSDLPVGPTQQVATHTFQPPPSPSPSTPGQDFLTPRHSFSSLTSTSEFDLALSMPPVTSQQSHPRLSRTSTPKRSSEGASSGSFPAPSLPLPPNPRRISQSTPGRALGQQTKPVQLCVSVCDAPRVSLVVCVCEPPPLSLVLRVEHPLPGIPEEVVKRLQQACTDTEQSAAALAEIETLDDHRAVLEDRIEALRHSPAALEVLRLQQHLLELQQREVAELEVQVSSLASVGDLLSFLRTERARLEGLADEVFEAEADLEEAQAVRDLRAKARAAKREAEAMDVEVAALEVSAYHLEAAVAKRDACVQRLAELRAQADEVESMQREIAALAGTEVVAAKLHSRRAELRAKAASNPDLEAQLQACTSELQEMNVKVAQLARLRSESRALALELASMAALEQEVASLREQLQALASLQGERQSLAERISDAKARLQGEGDQLGTVQELEARAQELRQQAEHRERLQAVCDNLAFVPQQVSSLEGRAEALKAAVAERQRLENLTLELEEQLLSGLGSAGGLEGARNKHQQMLAAVQEAQNLRSKVAMLAPEALQLASLREQHTALQREAAEASLLVRDTQLLRMQTTALRQLQLRASQGGLAAEGTHRVEDGERGEGVVVETEARDVGALLEGVFKHMRALEAEQLGQKAENEELQERVKDLSEALASSNKAVRKLKSLARAVGRIRSGFAPKEYHSSSGEEEEVPSPMPDT